MAESPRFGAIETWSQFREESFPAELWLELVQTFSTTLALEKADRAAFLRDLAAALSDHPRVVRRYEALVHLAPLQE